MGGMSDAFGGFGDAGGAAATGGSFAAPDYNSYTEAAYSPGDTAALDQQVSQASDPQAAGPGNMSQMAGGFGSMVRAIAPAYQLSQANQYAGQISTYGQYQAQALQNQATAQAQAQAMNAQLSTQNAAAVQQAAASDLMQQQRQDLAGQSTMRMGILNSGVAMQGTALQLIGEQAAQGSLAEAKVTQQGDVKATDYHNQAAQENYGGQMAQYNGNIQAQQALYQSQMQSYNIRQQAQQAAVKSLIGGASGGVGGVGGGYGSNYGGTSFLGNY